MKELNCQELKNIQGGTSLAYRIGQLLRGVFMSAGSMIGTAQFIMEVSLNESAS